MLIILLSKNQIAIKGIQKKECIEDLVGLENLNNNGKEFFLNINPVALEKKLLRSLTLIVSLLFFSLRLKVFRGIL